MTSRRELMKRSAAVAGMLATLGVLPQAAQGQTGWNKAAFTTRSMDDLMKALGASRPVESKDVLLHAPDIAENGATVAIGASTTLPGVKRVLLMVEKNPNLLSAMFELTDSIEPNISTRVKMSESSNVYAVMILADSRVLYARKDVKVTLGGCAE